MYKIIDGPWIEFGRTYASAPLPDHSALPPEPHYETREVEEFGISWDDAIEAASRETDKDGQDTAYNLAESIITWRRTQPDMVAYEEAVAAARRAATALTFEGAGLAKPGVLVEVDGATHLIGDVNTHAGTCGCCGGIPDGAIVTRYRVLLELGDGHE